jgi:erythromycin esterase
VRRLSGRGCHTAHGPPGHTEVYVEDLPPPDPRTVDALLAQAGLPLYLLDLRNVPADGPVAERFRAATGIMTGPHPVDVDPLVAYDALVFIDRLTPWETFIAPA